MAFLNTIPHKGSNGATEEQPLYICSSPFRNTFTKTILIPQIEEWLKLGLQL